MSSSTPGEQHRRRARGVRVRRTKTPKNPSTRATGSKMMETDWERWNAITPPTSWVNDWNEPYSEIYDWYPWMRKFYSRLEIESDLKSVRSKRSWCCCASYAREGLTCRWRPAWCAFLSRLPKAIRGRTRAQRAAVGGGGAEGRCRCWQAVGESARPLLLLLAVRSRFKTCGMKK